MNQDNLLEHLVGAWILTGQRDSIEFTQQVSGEWVLREQYLRLHCREIAPNSGERTPYEAIYMIGCDRRSGEYEFHLFDRFGPEFSRVVGVGTRDGNAIEFLFRYPSGLFSNTFTWLPERERWTMLLRAQDAQGGWIPWATKTLQRSSA